MAGPDISTHLHGMTRQVQSVFIQIDVVLCDNIRIQLYIVKNPCNGGMVLHKVSDLCAVPKIDTFF